MTEESRKKGKFARRFLGEILVANEAISQEQLEQALIISKDDGNKIGQTLIELGYIDDEAIARAISEQLSIPYVELMFMDIPEEVLEIIPEKVILKHLVLPISKDDTSLTIVMANPLDQSALEDFSFSTTLRINIAVAPEHEVLNTIAKYFTDSEFLKTPSLDSDSDANLTVYSTQKKDEDENRDNNDLLNLSDKPPIVKFTNIILGDAIKANASDIHIEPRSKSILIRFRVDGVMKDIMKAEKHIHSGIVTRIKVLSRMDISIRRAPQDGKFQVHYGKNKIDFRVSTLPTAYGEKITMRILNAVDAPESVNEIDLSAQSLKLLMDAIAKPQGIVLVTGPTGSGKTTTLYACLKTMMSPEVNIITLENPIEYELEGINQVEINPKQGLTFAGGLRSVLRQDPDIVLLGEIRDQETATIAFHAAQTGHLVLSTLHTNSALDTLSRLKDLNVESYSISNSLNAVIAQRLVRRLCGHCKEKYSLEDSVKKTLPAIFNTDQDIVIYRAKGCDLCDSTGYSGRIAIHEVLAITPKIKEILINDQPLHDIEREARQSGFTELSVDGIYKVVQGFTTLSEVFNVAPLTQSEDTGDAAQVAGKSGNTEQEEQAASAETAEAPAPPTPPPTPAPSPQPAVETKEKAKKSSLKILAVDDVETIRVLMQGVLEGEGHEVMTAVNGVEGFELAKSELPDLIITDFQMPEMNGFEMIRKLREEITTSYIPIIMLTADDDVETEIEVLNSGADDFLVKPFNARKLIARIGLVVKKNLIK